MISKARKYIIGFFLLCFFGLFVAMSWNCFKDPMKCKKLIAFLGAPFLSMSSKVRDASQSNLTLYYHHHSYYSKKVLLTLEEKNVPFHVYKVDIINNEQYQPWFLAINPRGEIPVLKDGEKIIIDSKTIIDFLDDNFSQGVYRSLLPQDCGSEVRKSVTELRRQIDAIEGNMIQFGLLFHREPVQESDEHWPYNIPGVKTALKGQVVQMASSLRNLTNKYPDIEEVLLEKAKKAEITSTIVQDPEIFEKELAVLRALFQSLEEQLTSHPTDAKNWWLCCDQFTQADVSLTILMDRLWRMGTANSFWGHLPRLKRYFERVQEREAYKAVEPTIWDDISLLWPVAVGLLVVVVSIVIAICVFI